MGRRGRPQPPGDLRTPVRSTSISGEWPQKGVPSSHSDCCVGCSHADDIIVIVVKGFNLSAVSLTFVNTKKENYTINRLC